MKKINIITIKWGDYYTSKDVNILCAAIKRNTKYDVDFYCFTENADGLHSDIIVKPLPTLKAPAKFNHPKASGLCDDNLGGLNGQRVFYFDIDSLIVGNLDELFSFDYQDKHYIINDWANRTGKKKNQVGQASCYTHIVGTLGYIKDYYEKNPDEVLSRFGTATQQYVSYMLIEKYGALNFFPDNWFKSFRFHCLPNPFLRWFLPSKKPDIKGLKMIAFHGVPNMSEAIQGKWGVKHKNQHKLIYLLKKSYKHIKPATWIKQYWRE